MVVDLDGTLVRTDLLVESVLRLARTSPLHLLHLPRWLLSGKSHLKRRVAERVRIDVSTLPYDAAVLERIRVAREEGRSVVLATASDHRLAESIADHLGCFDEVLGSDGVVNLCSTSKRDALVERYGRGGFDYAGNAKVDLPIFAATRNALVVNPHRGVARRASKLGQFAGVTDERPSAPRAWLKQLRLHQWAKNVLLFVPLAAAHELTDATRLVDVAVAFVLFGLCASSVYVLNDMLDLEEDRRHPRKRTRPFAAGTLSVLAGAIAAPGLLLVALTGAALLLPPSFLLVLLGYYATTLAYSLALKRVAVVDVLVLAGLYTIRIVAGAAAAGLALTFWILAFSMFLFLSLAMIKRYAEVKAVVDAAQVDRRAGEGVENYGRGYAPSDLSMLSSLGGSAGYLAVLVLALYIQEPGTRDQYANPEFIWFACPLLLAWISRVWMLTHRGRMHDDPVHFALSDRVSIVVGLCFALVFWAAT